MASEGKWRGGERGNLREIPALTLSSEPRQNCLTTSNPLYEIVRSCQATESPLSGSPASFGVWIKLEGGDFPGPSLELRLVHTGLGFPNTALLLGTCKAKPSLQCCFSQARNYPLLTRYGGTCLEGRVWTTLGFPEANDLERKEGHWEWWHSLFVIEGQTYGKKQQRLGSLMTSHRESSLFLLEFLCNCFVHPQAPGVLPSI